MLLPAVMQCIPTYVPSSSSSFSPQPESKADARSATQSLTLVASVASPLPSEVTASMDRDAASHVALGGGALVKAGAVPVLLGSSCAKGGWGCEDADWQT